MAGCDDRRIGVAVDFSHCGKVALKWGLDNMVRTGDHLILINVQKDVHYEGGETQLWEATGSRMLFFSSSMFEILLPINIM